MRNFVGDWNNSAECFFFRMAIFNTWILLIYCYGRYFYLQMSFQIFQYLKHLSIKIFAFLKLLTQYTNILYNSWGFCDGYHFPDSCLSLLVIYMYGRYGFCDLMLYSDTLIEVFIKGRNFLVEFLGSFLYTIISSAKKRHMHFLPS